VNKDFHFLLGNIHSKSNVRIEDVATVPAANEAHARLKPNAQRKTELNSTQLNSTGSINQSINQSEKFVEFS